MHHHTHKTLALLTLTGLVLIHAAHHRCPAHTHHTRTHTMLAYPLIQALLALVAIGVPALVAYGSWRDMR